MSKIKIFALGGLNEDGKNMYVCDVDNDIFIFDAGLKYPRERMLGIDYMIPVASLKPYNFYQKDLYDLPNETSELKKIHLDHYLCKVLLPNGLNVMNHLLIIILIMKVKNITMKIN